MTDTTTTLDRLARIIERQQDRIEALERELSAERAKPRVDLWPEICRRSRLLMPESSPLTPVGPGRFPQPWERGVEVTWEAPRTWTSDRFKIGDVPHESVTTITLANEGEPDADMLFVGHNVQQ